MDKERLDLLMVEHGLAESRSQAQRLIMAGQVRVNGQMAIKPADKVSPKALIEVEQGPKFVSRGGEKLEPALEAFGLGQLNGRVCADIGASTGGFTDCLLQHGASRVYAVDVGYGVLHWKLRQDSRVISMERTNARYVKGFPEPVSLVTVDASFISLRILLPAMKAWFPEMGGEVVCLIKPQFEAGREESARGDGVIRDVNVHRSVLLEVLTAAEQEGFGVSGLVRSSLLGPKGNTEFLAHLVLPSNGPADLNSLVERALASSLSGLSEI